MTIQRVNGVTEGKSSRFKVHELLVQNVQAVQSLRSVQSPSFILILTSLQIDIEEFMFM